MRRHVLVGLGVMALLAAILLGVTSGESAGLVALGVFGFACLLAHLWFTTWGPNASPNRLYRRELWKNERRVHRELQAHRREVRSSLTPPSD